MYGQAIKYRSRQGLTLIELVVVIGIISVLLGLATIAFRDWLVKYNVESQVKQMVTDFSEMRVRAMTLKQRHSITVNQNNYVFKMYSSDDEALSAGTVIPGGAHPVKYALKSNSSTYYNGQVFEVDHRGMVVNTFGGTIYLDSDSSATVDCLTINTLRINPGKKNAGWSNCDDR
jgi:type IV fimbrial biogenesis protein FimT